MACTLLDCAQCCTIFSIAGLFFLLIIGSLLNSQPLYIKGPSDSAKASAACYNGALIYLGFLVVSAAYWIIHNITTASMAKMAQMNAEAEKKSNKKKKRSAKGGNYGAVDDDEL